MYCQYAKDQGYKYVTVKSPDTDVFFILVYYAKRIENISILFETGRGNKRRLLNITSFSNDISAVYSSALLSMHAYTGCDTVSAFKGRGKLKALKALQQNPRFIETLAKLGESWHMDAFLLDDVEAFTCAMYGRSNFTNVDDLRFYMLKEKCQNETISPNTNIDLSAIPPCRKSLKQHARRANFQIGIWKRAHAPDPYIPDASSGHGWHLCNGTLQPLWTEEEEELTLPDSVINDIIAETDAAENTESNVPDNENDSNDDTDFYYNEHTDSEEDDDDVW